MNNLRVLTPAVGLLFCAAVTAAAEEPASSSRAGTQPKTLCAAQEEPVFACTLQGSSRKQVALCALPQQDAAGGEPKRWSFRYVFGRPGKIELSYPPTAEAKGAFTSTHLTFAGNTGGRAYAFINADHKYVLYTISGTGFERSGLLVQREGDARAQKEMKCQEASLVESSNDALWQTTSAWKKDSAIELHGLPSTR